MAEATTTQYFRKKMAAYFAGGAVPTRPTYMAFGEGGHNPDGSAKAADDTQTALKSELIRIPLDELYQEDLLSVTSRAKLSKTDLVGSDLSEGGVLDADGYLIGFRNFARKTKDSDEEYELKLKLKF